MKHQITIETTLANPGPAWLVVGNGQEVLAALDTREEANAAMEELCPGEYGIEDSKWGCIEVVPPGNTITRRMVTNRPSTKAEKVQEEADWQEALKDMPWMAGINP